MCDRPTPIRKLHPIFTPSTLMSAAPAQKPLRRGNACRRKLPQRALQVRPKLPAPILDIAGVVNLREAFLVVIQQTGSEHLTGSPPTDLSRTGKPSNVVRQFAKSGQRHYR